MPNSCLFLCAILTYLTFAVKKYLYLIVLMFYLAKSFQQTSNTTDGMGLEWNMWQDGAKLGLEWNMGQGWAGLGLEWNVRQSVAVLWLEWNVRQGGEWGCAGVGVEC